MKEQIGPKTTDFPQGGSAVRISDDVKPVDWKTFGQEPGTWKVQGLDYGDVGSRGVAIVVFDGNQEKVYPESATAQVNQHRADVQNAKDVQPVQNRISV